MNPISCLEGPGLRRVTDLHEKDIKKNRKIVRDDQEDDVRRHIDCQGPAVVSGSQWEVGI